MSVTEDRLTGTSLLVLVQALALLILGRTRRAHDVLVVRTVVIVRVVIPCGGGQLKCRERTCILGS